MSHSISQAVLCACSCTYTGTGVFCLLTHISIRAYYFGSVLEDYLEYYYFCTHHTETPFPIYNFTKLRLFMFMLMHIFQHDRWLTMENNQLEVIPESMVNLASLVHLNLKNNRLAKFPEIISNIKALRFCFLNSNQIANISSEHLENTAFMKMLNINDNPFPDDELLSTVSIRYINSLLFCIY